MMPHQRACLLLAKQPLRAGRLTYSQILLPRTLRAIIPPCKLYTTETDAPRFAETPSQDESKDLSHLNPSPEDYSRFIFQDKCSVTMHAGSGGHGCVAFLREKYIEEGPPNGGDGGSGGGLYIQAVEGLTSLHKLARRGIVRAERGRNGQGKSKGGRRGDDVLIQVPVGTVVREIARHDPVAEELAMRRQIYEDQQLEQKERREQRLEQRAEQRAAQRTEQRGRMEEMEDGEEFDEMEEEEEDPEFTPIRHDRWVLYPGANPADFLTVEFPRLKPRRQGIAAMEPQAPIFLDLSAPMDKPLLLAAGGAGGLGNPHFIGRVRGRPKFASKGEGGTRLELDFELKLLADVGLVGKPNAGKSTLLRSLTNSRTRIGNWEFTTLSPHIGTVIVDNHRGRPLVESRGKKSRTHFTIADIPGLVEDAHLDRGLGLGFLRHIDRAGILAFVLDLSNGDPVQELQKLWHELGEYQRLRDEKPESVPEEKQGVIEWDSSSTAGYPEYEEDETSHESFDSLNKPTRSLPRLPMAPIHTKAWFVVATKADLENTQPQYRALQEYLNAVEKGTVDHPSGNPDGWKQKLRAVPISAIRGEGVAQIPKLVMEFLD
ncbi:GTPase Obg [Penicillium verhagenii]|uniref:GTPase Obg n=1 Tax=Penicillium verhagenii TaxID=1562060 RepID=UPI002544D612|nr:GTPase Obg [Penicillium verhagenii]KAJ5924194.1 GTPase Obg [Penicillium verhagenii]